MRQTIVVEVENRAGELARIVNLFAARGVNIETLNVSEANAANVSTVVVNTATDPRTTDQLLRVIRKQVRVLSAQAEEKTK